jgi:hypothetical protein
MVVEGAKLYFSQLFSISLHGLNMSVIHFIAFNAMQFNSL